MVHFVKWLGVSVQVTIKDGDIEDTEGYNPGIVTYHLASEHRAIVASLDMSWHRDFIASLGNSLYPHERRPACIEFTRANGDTKNYHFNEQGLERLKTAVLGAS